MSGLACFEPKKLSTVALRQVLLLLELGRCMLMKHEQNKVQEPCRIVLELYRLHSEVALRASAFR